MPTRPHKSSPKTQRPATPKPDPLIQNLEPLTTKNQLLSLQQLLTNKSNPRTRDAARLGDVLLPWFETVITKPAAKLDGLTDLLHSSIPANLLQHARILNLAKGTLSIALDSAPVRAQLDSLLRSGLLRKLQTASHGAIFRIKTSVDGTAPTH